MFKSVKLVLALSFVALVAACSTTQDNKVASVDATSAASYDPINDPNSSVYGKRSVYFDFDKYNVKAEYQSVITAHAAYLKANKDKKANIIIQGNTDERGTTEYNIALGQKRAEAVRKALALLGVKEAQVEAVSLGKDKPRATGSDEASWAQNRRSDIIYKK